MLNGTDITRDVHREPRAHGHRVCAQGREIFPLLTVEENLNLLGHAGSSRGRSRQIYQVFPVLKEMKNRRGGDLLAASRQQLASAGRWFWDPKLLILDERDEAFSRSYSPRYWAM